VSTVRLEPETLGMMINVALRPDQFITTKDYTNVSDSDVSRDSSVGITTKYGLDDRMIGVRFRAGAGNFFLRHRVQTGSGTHPASYPMGTEGSFSAGKAVGT
jgi:hypothetical protein